VVATGGRVSNSDDKGSDDKGSRDKGSVVEYTRGDRRTRLAHLLTEVFSPATSVVAICLVCGVTGHAGMLGWVWGIAAGCFCGVIPYVVFEVRARGRRLSSRHITKREERPWAFTVCIGSVVSVIALVLILDGPPLLMWCIFTMLGGLMVTAVVTMLWLKVSMHTFCLAFLGLLTAALISPWVWLPLTIALVLVAWSRLRLSHHTPREVAVGAALGWAVFLVAWPFLP
jgi:membrane-associated phospholipid phosphatase